jgi:hypothetical protein
VADDFGYVHRQSLADNIAFRPLSDGRAVPLRLFAGTVTTSRTALSQDIPLVTLFSLAKASEALGISAACHLKAN